MNHEDHRESNLPSLRKRNHQTNGKRGVDTQADTDHDVRPIQGGEPESSPVTGGRIDVTFELLDPGYAVTLIEMYPDAAADILRELGYTVWPPGAALNVKAWLPPADDEE